MNMTIDEYVELHMGAYSGKWSIFRIKMVKQEKNIYINFFMPIQYLKKLKFDLFLTSLSLGLLNHILNV